MKRRKRITEIVSHLGLMTMGAWAGLFSAGVLRDMPELVADSMYAFFLAAILLVGLLIYNRKHPKEVFSMKGKGSPSEPFDTPSKDTVK